MLARGGRVEALLQAPKKPWRFRPTLLHQGSILNRIAVASLHVVSHSAAWESLRGVHRSHLSAVPDAAGRWLAVLSAVPAGPTLAIVLRAHFAV